MQATHLPDEQLVLHSFEATLGPIDHWYDGTFMLRPASDNRRIELETLFVYEVGRLRSATRAQLIGAVSDAFAGYVESVRARLLGVSRLRDFRLTDGDLLELRIDGGPWFPGGEIRAD